VASDSATLRASGGLQSPGDDNNQFPHWGIAVITVLGFLLLVACLLGVYLVLSLLRKNREAASRQQGDDSYAATTRSSGAGGGGGALPEKQKLLTSRGSPDVNVVAAGGSGAFGSDRNSISSSREGAISVRVSFTKLLLLLGLTRTL
jgi:hypothetical protein